MSKHLVYFQWSASFRCVSADRRLGQVQRQTTPLPVRSICMFYANLITDITLLKF